MKKYKIKYRKKTVSLESNPRKGICECCGKRGKTNLHHWDYFYKTKDVVKNPILALDYTSELCFHCHRIANAITLTEKYKDLRDKLYRLGKI